MISFMVSGYACHTSGLLEQGGPHTHTHTARFAIALKAPFRLPNPAESQDDTGLCQCHLDRESGLKKRFHANF